MVVYKARRKVTLFKWILAGAIFVASLCVTFNDVYGAAF